MVRPPPNLGRATGDRGVSRCVVYVVPGRRRVNLVYCYIGDRSVLRYMRRVCVGVVRRLFFAFSLKPGYIDQSLVMTDVRGFQLHILYTGYTIRRAYRA